MEVGIFPTTFPRATLDETLDAMVALDLYASQVDLGVTGLPDLPVKLARRMWRAFAKPLIAAVLL
ncbi:MAG: hypothetical protein R2932_11155 [Caldilineaceae bacterium]